MQQRQLFAFLLLIVIKVITIDGVMKKPCKFMDKIEYGRLGEEVKLPGGIDAYVSHPKNVTSKGGVIVIHDINGWTLSNTRAIADMLMENRFTAILPDSFEGKPAWNRSFGANFFEFLRQRPFNGIDNVVDASIKYLRDEYSIRNVALVGFCWGGSSVHYMMATRKDISAGVSCYGIMDRDDPAYGDLSAPTLFIFGGADFIIPTKDIVHLRGALRKNATAKFAIRKYKGQPHGFVHRKIPSPNDTNTEKIYAARKKMIQWLNRFISKRRAI